MWATPWHNSFKVSYWQATFRLSYLLESGRHDITTGPQLKTQYTNLFKVQIFRGGHKNLKNSPNFFFQKVLFVIKCRKKGGKLQSWASFLLVDSDLAHFMKIWKTHRNFWKRLPLINSLMSKKLGDFFQSFVAFSEYLNYYTVLHFKISAFVYEVRWFQVVHAIRNFMAIQDFYYHFMQQSNWKWWGIFLVSS